MNRLSFGSTLIACVATAANLKSAQYNFAGYGHGYGGNASHSAFNTPIYGHSYNQAPAYGGYGHHHGYGMATNVWGAGVTDTAKSGWWSLSQQYSPPQIPYTPFAGSNVPLFA